ncbi:MAG: hypothetical protein GC168_06570 [Candidatus Hydrogenedens sp.]|nr:hypothetical protein [Candidatus Hydrogenedens sp.]
MSGETPARRPRRWPYVLIILILVLVGAAWWRMGSVIVEQAPPGSPGYHATGMLPLEFIVATYNVQARPWFDDTGYKFDGISPKLNPFDLVGIQECFKDHEDLWEGTTHPVRIYDGRLKNWYRSVGSGLSTLSRFPVTEVITEHFAQSGDFQNKPASKGMVLARADLGNGLVLDFYNTHLTAGSKEENKTARPAQVRQLIEFVKRNSPPEHLVIFGGDYNLRAHDLDTSLPADYPADLVGLNRGQLLTAICKELGFTDASETITGAIPEIVDHILYRSSSTHDLVPLTWQHDTETFFAPDGRPLSDHEPLIATFRVTEKTTTAEAPAE